jgi:hypothetical protein
MRGVWKLALVCGLGVAIGHAQATKWVSLSDARDLSFAIDTDSVRHDPNGYVGYLTKTTWRDAAQPPGATGAVAVSITRYQMNCKSKQWRLVESQYQAADGTPAGTYKPAAVKEWADIGPGTVVESIYEKIC